MGGSPGKGRQPSPEPRIQEERKEERKEEKSDCHVLDKAGGPVSRLLARDYWGLERGVLAEACFVELTELRRGIRLVHLALTRHEVVLAQKLVPEFIRDDPEMYADKPDVDLEELTLTTLFPLAGVKVTVRPEKFLLCLQPLRKSLRKFELCTTANVFDRFSVWQKWLHLVELLTGTTVGCCGDYAYNLLDFQHRSLAPNIYGPLR